MVNKTDTTSLNQYHSQRFCSSWIFSYLCIVNNLTDFIYVILYSIDIRVYHTSEYFWQHKRQVQQDECIQHHFLHPVNYDAFVRVLLRFNPNINILQNLRFTPTNNLCEFFNHSFFFLSIYSRSKNFKKEYEK